MTQMIGLQSLLPSLEFGEMKSHILFCILLSGLVITVHPENTSFYDDPFKLNEKPINQRSMTITSSRFDVGVSISVKNRKTNEAIRYLKEKKTLTDNRRVGAVVPLMVIAVDGNQNDIQEIYYIYLGTEEGFLSEEEVNEFIRLSGLDFINLF